VRSALRIRDEPSEFSFIAHGSHFVKHRCRAEQPGTVDAPSVLW
jgi:hypothetical protein